MNDLYWWMGFILFWAIVAAYILLWMLVSYGAWIRVWDDNKYLVIPFSRLVATSKRNIIRATESHRKWERETGIAWPYPDFIERVVCSDDNFKSAFGITRNKMMRVMFEAIRQAYFTKNN